MTQSPLLSEHAVSTGLRNKSTVDELFNNPSIVFVFAVVNDKSRVSILDNCPFLLFCPEIFLWSLTSTQLNLPCIFLSRGFLN